MNTQTQALAADRPEAGVTPSPGVSFLIHQAAWADGEQRPRLVTLRAARRQP